MRWTFCRCKLIGSTYLTPPRKPLSLLYFSIYIIMVVSSAGSFQSEWAVLHVWEGGWMGVLSAGIGLAWAGLRGCECGWVDWRG